MQTVTLGKVEAHDAGELVNGVDPLWVTVDRVIAQQDKKGKLFAQTLLYMVFCSSGLLAF